MLSIKSWTREKALAMFKKAKKQNKIEILKR